MIDETGPIYCSTVLRTGSMHNQPLQGQSNVDVPVERQAS